MSRLLRLIIFIATLAALIGGVYFSTQRTSVDYAALAQPTLAQTSAAITDDDRLTAILGAHATFIEIVRIIDNEADAQLALPTLQSLADEAKRLDDEMRKAPDARQALLKQRDPEVQQSTMIKAIMVVSIATKVSKVKVMTTISGPLRTLSSTLHP